MPENRIVMIMPAPHTVRETAFDGYGEYHSSAQGLGDGFGDGKGDGKIIDTSGASWGHGLGDGHSFGGGYGSGTGQAPGDGLGYGDGYSRETEINERPDIDSKWARDK